MYQTFFAKPIILSTIKDTMTTVIEWLYKLDAQVRATSHSIVVSRVTQKLPHGNVILILNPIVRKQLNLMQSVG